MITRNGAETIGRMIESVRPWVSEVCVLDTGSTDGTLALLDEIAAEPGAPIRIERAEWRDDFADARNRSFAMAWSDYLMWMDDDDILEGGEHLPALLAGHPDVALVRWIKIKRADYVMHEFRGRIVRAALGARWEGPIHETFEGTIPDGATRTFARPDLVRVVHAPVAVEGRHDHRAAVEAAPPTRHVRLSRGMYLLVEDHEPERAAHEFEAVLNPTDPWRWHEWPLLANAARFLIRCHQLRGDVAAMNDAKGTAMEIELKIRRDPIYACGRELTRRFPIAQDDPVGRYALDPRALHAAAAA